MDLDYILASTAEDYPYPHVYCNKFCYENICSSYHPDPKDMILIQNPFKGFRQDSYDTLKEDSAYKEAVDKSIAFGDATEEADQRTDNLKLAELERHYKELDARLKTAEDEFMRRHSLWNINRNSE